MKKRTLYIDINENIPNAATLLPQEAIQSIQEILEYGELTGKDSIQTEGIGYHIFRAERHYIKYRLGDTSEPHLKHAATRSLIVLAKYLAEKDYENGKSRE